MVHPQIIGNPQISTQGTYFELRRSWGQLIEGGGVRISLSPNCPQKGVTGGGTYSRGGTHFQFLTKGGVHIRKGC